MRARFFLDTNIFVYSVDRSEPRKAEVAAQLIRRALMSGNGVISYQVIQEFFNVALKRFMVPMRGSEAQQYLANTFLPIPTIYSSASLCAEALRLHATFGLSWYDALVVAAALQAGCDIFYTEDLQHGQTIGSLQIINPFV